jgi:hypothetical protein
MKPRCKKCGRVLSDPVSIARGMGPTCAGVSGGGRKVKASIKRRSGIPYNAGAIGSMQASLPFGDTTQKRPSKRELVRQTREERRRLFDERLPFQCGLLLPERKPIFYTPTEDGGWKNSTSGRVIPHEQLQSYLKRCQFI